MGIAIEYYFDGTGLLFSIDLHFDATNRWIEFQFYDCC